MTKDMTKGSLIKHLIIFCLPLILSGLLQQLYSWADAFILGNYAGEKALAAAGVCTAISNFFVLGITGFTSGVAILSARYMGMGENSAQKKILSTFLIILIGFILLLSVSILCFSKGFLTLLGTPEDIFILADYYLKIILIGIPFLAVYNVFSAVLRGIGNSKNPFYAVLISSVVNVVLDILFVGVFRQGVRGAAVATVISQILMTAYIVAYGIGKYKILRFSAKEARIDREILREGMTLSLPITIQSMASSLGTLILQNFMNSFGTVTVAAITAAYRIDCILLIPIINLGTGIATVASQNLGARKYDRVKNSLKSGLLLTTIFSACLAVLIFIWGASLIRMFGVSEEAVRIGGDFFRILAVFYVVFGGLMSARGYIEGVGKAVVSGTISIVGIIIRIALSYILRPYFGNMVIAYAETISWTCQAVALLLYAFVFVNSHLDKLAHVNSPDENSALRE